MKVESLAGLRRQAKQYGVNTLITVGGNTKIIKGDKKGVYLTAIMHLAPSNESGYNVCPFASDGCKAACLYTAGLAQAYPTIKESRIARTKLFFEHRDLFTSLLFAEIDAFIRKTERKGVKPAIRLNGTSDIVWERILPEVFTNYPSVIFYDYTKIAARFRNLSRMPKNYYLLFSRSENNDRAVKRVLRQGGNVAVVFKKIPREYLGKKVINGDKTGRIIGLNAKGKAKKDMSGFVVAV